MTSKLQQDEAAGGADRRLMRLSDGRIVKVSIAVRNPPRFPKQRYAYLRFKSGHKTVTKYVGRVTADTREKSLALGWRMVKARKIAESCGWAWVE